MNSPNTTPAFVGTTDDDALIAELPDLRIEVSHSEDMVILQQGRSGEEDRIAIHRWQVRMLAEQFGLLPARTQARATVETLARRLLKLRERIDRLGEHLHVHVEDQCSLQYAMATCEIADEFIADLDVLTGGTVTAPKRVSEVRP